MRLVVGLGNPGTEYRGSRHNLGFRVVEELARRRGIALGVPYCGALVGRAESLVLAAPQTFMNRSGLAVRGLVEHEMVSPDHLLVVFDDLALPLGRIRIRGEGGPGGHRGLASVLEQLRTDVVPRLRLGIGPVPAGVDVAEWVLSAFVADEAAAVAAMVGRAADACEAWLEEPLAAVAARFNAPPPAAEVDGDAEA